MFKMRLISWTIFPNFVIRFPVLLIFSVNNTLTLRTLVFKMFVSQCYYFCSWGNRLKTAGISMPHEYKVSLRGVCAQLSLYGSRNVMVD